MKKYLEALEYRLKVNHDAITYYLEELRQAEAEGDRTAEKNIREFMRYRNARISELHELEAEITRLERESA